MSDRRGFDRIIGQELAKRVLARAVAEGRPSHAYLFIGMQGTGKTATAIEFAKALNCEDAIEGRACGQCRMCLMVEHGTSPDVRVWSPPPGRKNTLIEQMQEMRSLAGYRPVHGRWKVDIIEQGETLNAESASCILKLLEEPPDYEIIILLYRNASSVLATIASRCRLVRFTPVDAGELAARLASDFGVEPERAAFLAAYSQGCPGRAISLTGDEEFLQKREEIIGTASAASSAEPWVALKLAEIVRSGGTAEREEQAEEQDEETEREAISDEAAEVRPTLDAQPAEKPKKRSAREKTLEALDVLATWYRDLLAARVSPDAPSVVNADKIELITSQAARYSSPEAIAAAVDAILEARRGILGNANPQIATEALMTRLML